MRAIESWVLAYLLNSLWQIPLLYGMGLLAVRLVRGLGPQAEHRVWVSVLMLQVLLPACAFRITEMLRSTWAWMLNTAQGNAVGGHVHVAIAAGATGGHGVLRLPNAILACVLVVYAGSVLYFAGQLAWRVLRTNALKQRSTPVEGELSRSWATAGRTFGISGARVAVSHAVVSPVTVGILNRFLLVPSGFLEAVDAEDLDAAVAHEFAHMQRHDFAKNLLYALLSLPITYHPLLWMTRRKVTESREMVCDAMAAEAVAGREHYARSLLRLAALLIDRAHARPLHAIGIFDANIFERRVMKLVQSGVETKGARRFAVVAACMAVGVATCGTALALRMEVKAPAAVEQTQTTEQNSKNPRARISAGVLESMIITKVQPIYPQTAKDDKVSGKVVLKLMINEEGEPTDVSVSQGAREDLNQSAVAAVSQWRWKPYILNGDPTAVESTVVVNYTIGG